MKVSHIQSKPTVFRCSKGLDIEQPKWKLGFSRTVHWSFCNIMCVRLSSRSGYISDRCGWVTKNESETVKPSFPCLWKTSFSPTDKYNCCNFYLVVIWFFAPERLIEVLSLIEEAHNHIFVESLFHLYKECQDSLEGSTVQSLKVSVLWSHEKARTQGQYITQELIHRRWLGTWWVQCVKCPSWIAALSLGDIVLHWPHYKLSSSFLRATEKYSTQPELSMSKDRHRVCESFPHGHVTLHTEVCIWSESWSAWGGCCRVSS